MAIPESLATVVRVPRHDTLLIRTHCPLIQASVSTYMTPANVWCDDGAESAIIDWVELHADHGRLRLETYEWLRDDHGKLLGDLIDTQTGECLTQYLLEQSVAKPRPHHITDVMYALMNAKEPE